MTARTAIDLNCDMGEIPALIADGTQEALMQYVTSVNVACGGHAGDTATMKQTISRPRGRKLAVGAHPGYPDRANFGRLDLRIEPVALADFVFEQVRTLTSIAEKCGVQITHVKPHGALDNQAAHDLAVARAIADGVARCSRDVVIVGLAGSTMLICSSPKRVSPPPPKPLPTAVTSPTAACVPASLAAR